jgi:thioredoxin 1
MEQWKKATLLGLVLVLVGALWSYAFLDDAKSAQTETQVPVKGMVTMVDFGAKKCIPCKMMAPILEKLKKEYEGRAAIVFFDVWEDSTPAKRFGVRGIPTQIFFNKNGEEEYRHMGYMSEAAIVTKLKFMGVN